MAHNSTFDRDPGLHDLSVATTDVDDQHGASDNDETTALLHPIDKKQKTWIPRRLMHKRYLALLVGAVVFVVAVILAGLWKSGKLMGDEKDREPEDGVSLFDIQRIILITCCSRFIL